MCSNLRVPREIRCIRNTASDLVPLCTIKTSGKGRLLKTIVNMDVPTFFFFFTSLTNYNKLNLVAISKRWVNLLKEKNSTAVVTFFLIAASIFSFNLKN